MNIFTRLLFACAFYGVASLVPEAAASEVDAVINPHGSGPLENAGVSDLQSSSRNPRVRRRGKWEGFVMRAAAAVAMVFALLMCARKLTSNKSGASRRLAGEERGHSDAAGDGGDDSDVCAPEGIVESPGPVPGTMPTVSGVSSSALNAEESFKAAVSSLYLFNYNSLAWQVEYRGDPTHSGDPERQLYVIDEPEDITYPEEWADLVNKCKERVLKLRREGGDGKAVADNVIQMFEDAAAREKSDHFRSINMSFEECAHKCEIFLKWLKEQELESKENKSDVQRASEEFLKAKMFQYAYLDDWFFNSRQKPAEDAKQHLNQAIGNLQKPTVEAEQAVSFQRALQEYEEAIKGSQTAASQRVKGLQSAFAALTFEITAFERALQNLKRFDCASLSLQEEYRTDPSYTGQSPPRELVRRESLEREGRPLPENLKPLVEECKAKVLALKVQGGDAKSVADEVIGRFREEAQRIMAENFTSIERARKECEGNRQVFLTWLREQSGVTGENMASVEETSQKVLQAILYRHAYVDAFLYNSRQHPADVARQNLEAALYVLPSSVKEDAAFKAFNNAVETFDSSSHVARTTANHDVKLLRKAFAALVYQINKDRSASIGESSG